MELYLENLHCSHCANQIETKIKNLPHIRSAKLNFLEKKIMVVSSETSQDDETIFDQIRNIVSLIEPDIVVSLADKKHRASEASSGISGKLIILISALLLFILSFFLRGYFPFMLGVLVTSYFLVGFPVMQSAVKNLFQGNFLDENFLMTIASLGAFAIGQYSEAVAVMLFYNIGEYFQNMAVDKSGRSIKSLIELQPEFANRIILTGTQKVNPRQLSIGEKIKILPGEKVPVDATVLQGNSTLDAASITGESLPIDVRENDKVISGMINKTGVLVCIVDKTYEDSTVNQIMELVEKAGYKKSKTENLITKFAKYYTPIVVGVAIALPLIAPFITGDPVKVWIYRSLIFLVISCPCAMVISIPLSYFAGIGTSSSHGILAKGSNFIESMAQADTIVFDKTGTLTRGRFSVDKVFSAPGVDKALVISYAKKLEENSNHPVAVSIQSCSSSEFSSGILPESIELDQIFEIPGKGIQAKEHDQDILLGNKNLMAEYKICVPDIESRGTVVYLARDKEYMGAVSVVDTIRSDAKTAIHNLKKHGIKNIYMLTGDRKASAELIAQELNLSGFKADLLPQDKVHEMEKIMARTDKKVIFVGDGTNDAPVLAMADVGIAMAELGSDAAIESSDVTIMNGELNKVHIFRTIAKKTRTVAIENIAFSLIVKAVIMGLGIAGIANMWMAVFGDVGVSLLAILNALRVMVNDYGSKPLKIKELKSI